MAMTDATTLAVINTKNQQGVESEIRKTQYSRKHITLFYDTDTWKVKDHTVTTPTFAALTEQSYYEPPFEIRGINLDDASEVAQIINYDTKVVGRDDTAEAGEPDSFLVKTVTFKGISERLATNQIHPIGAVKINLAGSTTTATLIHLHG